MFEALQLAAVEALTGAAGPRPARCARIYQRRRDLVIGALREIGIEIEPPKGTIYVWAPVPEGHTSASFAEEVLERSRRDRLARLLLRPERRGLVPHLAHDRRTSASPRPSSACARASPASGAALESG